ncbi:unnamed protein product [Vitrella brassicaformis CCMP3155]|uniref:Uncharacterized protein n=1 Tax=Vitrella brassicaformis (strain CCMP3155) TaxID=1169540 RepID=A0A0G4F5F6_VITBC|nr:unnamed protein product [Vitrella brassicaformis CCMP3155]|eukprot:CEM07567.1 unnamed protein product [Vitrella brassicaformis CCMP3155]
MLFASPPLLCGVQQAAWHLRQMSEQLEVEVSYAKPAKEHKINNALPAMASATSPLPPSAPTTTTQKTTTGHTAGSKTSSACQLLQAAWVAVKGVWEGVSKMVAGCSCTNMTNVA